MSRFRDRERPRAEPSPNEKLERLVATCRVPEELTLDALTSGISEAEFHEHGRMFPVGQIIDDAVGVYLKAFTTLRMSNQAQREAIRGCTLELIALVSAQVVNLANLVKAKANAEKGRASALDATVQQHRALSTKVLTLREQARRLLMSMARDDGDLQEEVARAASCAEGGDTADALWNLASIGRRLLLVGSGAMSMRARLLGLDQRYVEQLEASADALRICDVDLLRLRDPDSRGDDVVLVQAGITLFLMMHVIEAFTAARIIEPSIPVLKTVHTTRLLKGLSRMPSVPPPSQHRVPGRSKVDPRSAPKAGTADTSAEPQGNPFEGGMGRTTLRF